MRQSHHTFSGEGVEVDYDGIREVLWQEVACSKVLVLPVLDGLPLVIWDLGWVFEWGAGDGALKIGPPLGHLHCFTEAQDEYGPIRAICLKAWDVGGKCLDGSISNCWKYFFILFYTFLYFFILFYTFLYFFILFYTFFVLFLLFLYFFYFFVKK